MGLPCCEPDVQVLPDADILFVGEVGEVAAQVGVIELTGLAAVGTTWAVGLFFTGLTGLTSLIDPGERRGTRV